MRLTLLTLLVLAAPVEAGPWVKRPGHLYSRVGYSLFWANQAWDAGANLASLSDSRFLRQLGQLFDGAEYRSHSLSAYVEVGAFPYFELFAGMPLIWAESRYHGPEIQQSNFGAGDLQVGLRGGHTRKWFAGSGALAVVVPLYDNQPSALGTAPGNSDFYDNRVALGQGTIDVNLTLSLGASLPRLRGWVAIEPGVRIRNRGYSTALFALLQLGTRPVERLALMLNLEILGTFSDGTAPDFYFDQFGKGPTIIDRQQYLKVGGVMMLDLWRGLALEVGLSGVAVGARTAAGLGVGLGVSYRR